jgi:signal transduction histidine kinase
MYEEATRFLHDCPQRYGGDRLTLKSALQQWENEGGKVTPTAGLRAATRLRPPQQNRRMVTYLPNGPRAETLATFIRDNVDSIVSDWEAFAVTLKPAAGTMTALALRDHAREMLLAIAGDIAADQTDAQQSDKSKGWSPVPLGKESAAAAHGATRQQVGFDLRQHAAEYRALRASVLSRWRRHQTSLQDPMLAEMTRFNEAVDQALAESVASYADEMMRSHDTFLAMLGHDLRSPLSAVAMFAHYLAASESVLPEGRQAVARITKSVLTMSLMIRDLLEFTRSRLGSIPIMTLTYDIGQVCEDAHDEVQRAHPERVVDLEMTGDLHAEIDPARIGQVLSNLLNNAIKYGEGLPIVLSARGEGDCVVIQVENQGSPIPADQLQVIFDPLVQVADRQHGTTNSSSTSMGLGHFIAREIVTGHRGSLRVTSSASDGTTFTITLPRTSNAGHEN